MFTPILLGSGLFWTVTYLLIIRRGFRDQTYGMPLVALCANLAWEFIFSSPSAWSHPTLRQHRLAALRCRDPVSSAALWPA